MTPAPPFLRSHKCCLIIQHVCHVFDHAVWSTMCATALQLLHLCPLGHCVNGIQYLVAIKSALSFQCASSQELTVQMKRCGILCFINMSNRKSVTLNSLYYEHVWLWTRLRTFKCMLTALMCCIPVRKQPVKKMILPFMWIHRRSFHCWFSKFSPRLQSNYRL